MLVGASSVVQMLGQRVDLLLHFHVAPTVVCAIKLVWSIMDIIGHGEDAYTTLPLEEGKLM